MNTIPEELWVSGSVAEQWPQGTLMLARFKKPGERRYTYRIHPNWADKWTDFGRTSCQFIKLEKQ
jgi:hypothetical protein